MNTWQGTRVRLRAVEPADAETHFLWNQDSEMPRGLDYVWPPASRESVRRWAERTATEPPKGDELNFEIEDLEGTVVGNLCTHHCDRRTGCLSYGVAIRREHQCKGYASEAIFLVLRYFFEELRYQKVTVQVYSFNTPSIRLHERLGFQLEGRLRRTVYTHGRHYDELVYGMTVEEFREAYPVQAGPESEGPEAGGRPARRALG